MCSLAGEEVALLKPVTITDAVEVWLKQLNENMKATLTQLIASAIESGASDIERLPSQVLCVAEVVAFTRDCEAALKGGKQALLQLKEALRVRLNELTSFPTQDAPLTELKVKALVLDIIHNRDVVDQLLSAGTAKLDDWQWRKQLVLPDARGHRPDADGLRGLRLHVRVPGQRAELVHTP